MANTPFKTVQDRFFDYVTDDFYAEVCPDESESDLQSLLRASLPLFEFPKMAIDYDPDLKVFSRPLTNEEVGIIAIGMAQIWVQRQTTSIELTRPKYTGPDFKASSQGAHLQRLIKLKEDTLIEGRRLQRLYSRRRVNSKDGAYESTFDMMVKRIPGKEKK